MRKNSLVYIVWQEGKHYVSQCLNVDVSSFGSTRKKAVQNLEEALALYLEDAPARISKIQSPVIIESKLQYA